MARPNGMTSSYFALGGDAGFVEVEAYLHGLMPLAPHERDVLAHVLLGHLVVIQDRYTDDLDSIRRSRPRASPPSWCGSCCRR